MHLSDSALGALLDPAGGGIAAATARAHAAGCAECRDAIRVAHAADRDVAALFLALDHSLPLLEFSVVEARASQPETRSSQAPRLFGRLLRPSAPGSQADRATSPRALHGRAARWPAVLLVAASVAAAAVPGSPVRRLISALRVRDRAPAATAPASSPSGIAPATPGRSAPATPRGVAIVARGHAVLAFRLRQREGAILLTTATTPDPQGARVSVLANGDGATYTVSQDTIAINNRDVPSLDYDVVLPPPSQLPVVSIRVAGRVVFSRTGDAVETTGVARSRGTYAIPLSGPGLDAR